MICEGFSNAIVKVKSFHQDPIDSPPLPLPASTAGGTRTAQQSPKSGGGSRFRSDHLVTRMKMFFQGAVGGGMSAAAAPSMAASAAGGGKEARKEVARRYR